MCYINPHQRRLFSFWEHCLQKNYTLDKYILGIYLGYLDKILDTLTRSWIFRRSCQNLHSRHDIQDVERWIAKILPKVSKKQVFLSKVFTLDCISPESSPFMFMRCNLGMTWVGVCFKSSSVPHGTLDTWLPAKRPTVNLQEKLSDAWKKKEVREQCQNYDFCNLSNWKHSNCKLS